ncbi:restriction endonuclease subunit S [Shewanella frigidimarina]|uniref:restriction endonuclease subunit S n=1 Tax=Shewanella frigidimarina TaxID=56812 RepID=UPI003D7B5DC2
MTGPYKTYPEYKDAESQWLDEIPLNWKVTALKHVLSTPITDGPHSTPIFHDQGIPFVSAEAVSGGFINFDKIRGFISEEDYFLFSQKYLPQLHDVYMIKSGATTGITAIVETDMKFNIWSPLAVMRCKNSFNPYYLLHYLRSDSFQNSVQLSWTFGTQQNIGMSTLENLTVCYPSIQEQQKIANFLDHETAKIDTLIAKQEKLIELLKEKHQAVISHAVTKGLNPDAPMKDSGVDWLGEVPEHWVVCCLKHIKGKEKGSFVDGPFGSNLKSEHFVNNGDVYVIESNFATTGVLDKSKLKTISNAHFSTISRSETKQGAIIIAKIGARYGMNSIMPPLDKKAVVSGNSLSLSVDTQRMNVDYCHHLLAHLKQEKAMDDGVNVTAQPALSLGQLNNLPFLALPLKEQDKIVAFLEKQKGYFSSLISNSEKMVELSKERKTALISAAVTGKIDVRDWEPTSQQNGAQG